MSVRLADRAWIAYCDAYLDALFPPPFPAEDKQASSGSMYPMNYLLALTDLVKAHTQALRTMRRRYSGE